MKYIYRAMILVTLMGCGENKQHPEVLDLEVHSAWILDREDVDREVLVQFENSNIRYHIDSSAGVRKIFWKKEYDEKVNAVSQHLFGKPPPPGRYVSFPDFSLYAKLQSDLGARDIDFDFYHHDGLYGETSYLSWNEGDAQEVGEILKSYDITLPSKKEFETIIRQEERRQNPGYTDRNKTTP